MIIINILTQTWVNEPIPNAPSASDQPPPLGAGCEAERSPQQTNQQVARGDAHQHEIHGRAQSSVPAEQREHQEVTEKPESADEAQAHRHHKVPSRAQGRRGQGTGYLLVRVRRLSAAGYSLGTVRAAQAQVGNYHTGMSREVCTSQKFVPREGTIRSRCFSLIWRGEGVRMSPQSARMKVRQGGNFCK